MITKRDCEQERPERIKVVITGKGQYVLPLALALNHEMPELTFQKCLDVAEGIWARLDWPEVIGDEGASS